MGGWVGEGGGVGEWVGVGTVTELNTINTLLSLNQFEHYLEIFTHTHLSFQLDTHMLSFPFYFSILLLSITFEIGTKASAALADLIPCPGHFSFIPALSQQFRKCTTY